MAADWHVHITCTAPCLRYLTCNLRLRVCNNHGHIITFSALTLLVGHPKSKKICITPFQGQQLTQINSKMPSKITICMHVSFTISSHWIAWYLFSSYHMTLYEYFQFKFSKTIRLYVSWNDNQMEIGKQHTNTPFNGHFPGEPLFASCQVHFPSPFFLALCIPLWTHTGRSRQTDRQTWRLTNTQTQRIKHMERYGNRLAQEQFKVLPVYQTERKMRTETQRTCKRVSRSFQWSLDRRRLTT